MTEGDEGDSMYVIVSAASRGCSRNGRQVAALGAGDAVGELALLARSSAERDRRRRQRPRGRRDQPPLAEPLVHDVPSFSLKLLEAMAARVRELDSRLYP